MKTQGKNLVLDDTLRHLYITLRRRGAQLLAIRFVHRGKKWEADTPEEAVRLRQTLENQDIHEANSDPDLEDHQVRSESVWTPDTFWNFVHGIGSQQQKAVIAMLKQPGIRADALAGELGIEEGSFGGVLSGLSKQLKQFELRPSDLYLVHTDWSDGERKRLFFLERAFRLAADEVGWPDERSQKNAPATTRKRK
jgi:hypothetical protein